MKNLLLSHIKREIPHLIGKLKRGEIELDDFLATRVVGNLLHCHKPTPWIVCHALGNGFAEGSWEIRANATGDELEQRKKGNEDVVKMAEEVWLAYNGEFGFDEITALWNHADENQE